MVCNRFILLSVVLGSGGCGSQDLSANGELARDGDGRSRLIDRVLMIESERELALGVDEQHELRVRLVSLEGEDPIPGQSVSFSIEGPLEDSSLKDLAVLTNDDGIASNTVYAGQTSGRFMIHIDSEGAETADIDVTVSRRGFGTILVEAPYNGKRGVTKRTLTIIRDGSGDDAKGCRGVNAMLGDQQNPLPEGSSELPLLLPAHDSYVLMANATGDVANASDDEKLVLATACVDGVVVDANRIHAVNLTFTDEPLQMVGRFDMLATLQQGAPSLGDVMEAAFDARLGQIGVSNQNERYELDAQFLLETLDKALRAQPKGFPIVDAGASLSDAGTSLSDAGMDASVATPSDAGIDASLDGAVADTGTGVMLANALLAEAKDGEFVSVLAARLADAQVGPRAMTRALSAQVATSLATTTLLGELSLSPGQVTWLATRLRAAALSDAADAPTIDFEDPEPETATAIYDADDDSVEVGAVRARWPWGELASKALFLAASDQSRGDINTEGLMATMGCAALEATLAAHILDTSACGPACTADVCDRALSTLLLAGQTALIARDEPGVEGDLELRFVLYDSTDDLIPDGLVDGRVTGRWGGNGDAQGLLEEENPERAP